MTFIVIITLMNNHIIDGSYFWLILRASFVILGIFYTHSQKKMIRWFYMSDGESLNGLLFGIPVFAVILFVPDILRICLLQLLSIADTIVYYSMQ